MGPDGNLYVAGQDNGAVLRFSGTTGVAMPSAGNPYAYFASVTAPGHMPGDQEAFGVAFGPDGNLYVAIHDATASKSDKVLRFNGNTGGALPSAGNSGADFVTANSAGLDSPDGLAFGPDGNLYVAANGGVHRYDGTTGAPVGNGLFGSAGGGAMLAFDSHGNLYTSSFDNKVRRYDSTGAPLPSAGNGGADFVTVGSAGLTTSAGLAFGPDGNLYVSSRGTNQVLRYDGTTGAPVGTGVFVSAGSAGLNDPTFLTFTPQQASAVPEPASCTLLSIGAAVLSGHYWRRRA